MFASFGDNQHVEFFSAGSFEKSLGRLETLLGLSDNPNFNSDFWFAISHSGIRLPLRGKQDQDLSLRSASSFGKCLGMVRLEGKLRPGLSLSREQLQDLPWELFVALEYATRQHFHALGFDGDDEGIATQKDILSGADLCDFPSIARLETIGEMLDWTSWHSIPLFATDDGITSLDEIMRAVRANKTIRLNVPRPAQFIPGDDVGFSRDRTPVISAIQAFLLNAHVEVEPAEESKDGFNACAVRERTTRITEVERVFAPMLFADIGHDGPFRLSTAFINSEHPLAKWLLVSAARLEKEHAVAWNLLTSVLYERPSAYRAAERLYVTATEALELIRAADPALAPPRASWPKETDFL
jgi:hypothetical protein